VTRTNPPYAAKPGLWFVAALVAILCVLLVAQIWTIHHRSLWYDEARSWEIASVDLPSLFPALIRDEPPPLYNLILWVVVHLFGDSELALRLPSALLATGAVGLVGYLGLRLGGSFAGLAAAALLAVSPFLFHYGQEARMYGLLAFTSTLTATAVLRYLWQPSLARLALVAVAGIALLYTHIYGGPLLCGMAAGAVPLVWQDRGRLWPLVLTGVLIGLSFVPWLAVAEWAHISRIAANGFWLPPLSAELISSHTLRLFGGPVAAGVLGVAAVIGLAGNRERWRHLLFVVSWGASSFVAGIVVSLVVTPVFYDRYLTGMLPPVAVLGGLGVAVVLTRFGRVAAVAALAAACLASVVWRVPPPVNFDWRGPAEALAREVTADDCVVFVVWWGPPALQYYWRDHDACFVRPNPPDQIAFPAGDPKRVFLVAAHGGDYPRETALATLKQSYRLVDERTFTGVRFYLLAR
jgi:4-amino-4-deoxy-L-arabinose transferase-like glycosyltransferase